jgi:hypothetical protein
MKFVVVSMTGIRFVPSGSEIVPHDDQRYAEREVERDDERAGDVLGRDS